MRAFKPMMKSADPNGGFNQVLWSDAIYVRDWLRFDVLATPKLKKLAVLLHDIVAPTIFATSYWKRSTAVKQSLWPRAIESNWAWSMGLRAPDSQNS